MTKALVCGSRQFNNYELLEDVLKQWDLRSIVEGGAGGADTLAREFANRNEIPCTTFQAQWEKYGKAAGPIRNSQMLREANPDVVIAFLSKTSIGTKDMIAKAQQAGIKTYIVEYD